jgi:hypothetical protein
MKKDMTINKGNQISVVDALVAPIAAIYSRIMGVKFNSTDTLHILQVQATLLMLLLPVEFNGLYHPAMLLWFGFSLYQCKYLNEKFPAADE